jgi:predicted RNA-binding protein with EMAP domain
MEKNIDDIYDIISKNIDSIKYTALETNMILTEQTEQINDIKNLVEYNVTNLEKSNKYLDKIYNKIKKDAIIKNIIIGLGGIIIFKVLIG